MSAVQAILLRKYLYDELASEMMVLKNEQQLLKTWRTQQGMTGEASEDEVESAVALQLILAKESIVSVAMKLHAKVLDIKLSTVWAKALRDVLGENYLTDGEAKQMHKKAWESDVQLKIDRRATIPDEYDALVESGAASAALLDATLAGVAPETAADLRKVSSADVSAAAKAALGAVPAFAVYGATAGTPSFATVAKMMK